MLVTCPRYRAVGGGYCGGALIALAQEACRASGSRRTVSRFIASPFPTSIVEAVRANRLDSECGHGVRE